MKRRDFLSLGAGSAIAVAAPLPRLAMAAPAVRAPRNLFVWAVAMARAGNPISVGTLELALKDPAEQAQALIGRLVSQGVVQAPNALGIARAARPAFSGQITSPKAAARARVDNVRTALRKRADLFADKAEQEIGKDDPEVKEADPVSSPPTCPPTP
ncbi:hypothetical protein [Antarctobacter jejuensis]|uniref:hypothetical protein n=1 Tax=Antarctobacter jejuensis TaxID=1439938 RepID=UPI003FD257B1